MNTIKIETYKGIDIYHEPQSKLPYTTVKNNVPVIGVLQVGHKSIEDAKTYIDKTQK